MTSLWKKIQFARAFMKLSRDVTKIENVFIMEDILLSEVDESTVESQVPELFSNLEFQKLYAELYAPAMPSVKEMLQYEDGSLGKHLAKMLQERGFDLNFYPPVSIVDKMSYLKARARTTHDLIHVLTGYDTDVEGEIAVQGFTLGQTGVSPTSIVIVSAGLLNLLFLDPKRIRTGLALFVDAWNRGQKSRFYLGVRLEDFLKKPLVKIREEMNILPPNPVKDYKYICVKGTNGESII